MNDSRLFRSVLANAVLVSEVTMRALSRAFEFCAVGAVGRAERQPEMQALRIAVMTRSVASVVAQ